MAEQSDLAGTVAALRDAAAKQRNGIASLELRVAALELIVAELTQQLGVFDVSAPAVPDVPLPESLPVPAAASLEVSGDPPAAARPGDLALDR